MDNTLRLRASEELIAFYKGKPDEIRKALELYKMKKEGFLKEYEKESK